MYFKYLIKSLSTVDILQRTRIDYCVLKLLTNSDENEESSHKISKGTRIKLIKKKHTENNSIYPTRE